MIPNQTEARREMFEMLLNAVAAADWSVPGFDGVAPFIHYDGRQKTDNDPEVTTDDPKMEIYMRPATARQGSLSDPMSKRRWSKFGTLWVKCLGPTSSGKGLEMAEYQATIATQAFEGRQSERCIWFRNVRSQYEGEVDGWYQINVLMDYTYDELR